MTGVISNVDNIKNSDSLIPSLIIYDVYYYIITNFLSSAFQKQPINVMAKIMSKLYKLKA